MERDTGEWGRGDRAQSLAQNCAPLDREEKSRTDIYARVFRPSARTNPLFDCGEPATSCGRIGLRGSQPCLKSASDIMPSQRAGPKSSARFAESLPTENT